MLKDHPASRIAEALRLAGARGIREPADVKCLLLRIAQAPTGVMEYEPAGPVALRRPLDEYEALVGAQR